MKQVKDRVLETSTTTGTGALTLAGAVTGYRAASAVCTNGETFNYYAEDVDGSGIPIGGWEVGIGTWGTGNILTRTKILASSNSGNAVSWAAGTRRVALALVADALSSLYPITKNYVGTRLMAIEAQGTNATAGSDATWSLQCAVPDDFVAVRLIIANHHTADIVGVTCCASSGATATDRVNNSGTWTTGTFNNGSATGTLPLAASTADPTLTVSDWINVRSVARGDGGSYKLAYVRIMIPGATNTVAPMHGFGSSMASWRGKADGMEWAWTIKTGDFVTTPSGMTSASDVQNCCIVGIQYLTKNGATISNAFFGDSITSGTGATIPGDNWGHRASTSYGIHAAAANCGIAGQTMLQVLTRAKRYIPLLKPTHVWLPTFSPNGTAISAVVANQQYMQIMQVVELCRQNGVSIIFWSGCPRATSSANSASYYSNTDDDFRKNLALSLGAIGVTLCDIAAVMSDTNVLGTASKWTSGAATADGIHPSEAGYATMATAALATMHQLAP